MVLLGRSDHNSAWIVSDCFSRNSSELFNLDAESFALNRYIIPAALSHSLRLLPSSLSRLNPCSLDSLRFFNLSILAFLPLLYTSLLLAIRESTFSKPAEKKLKSAEVARKAANLNSARWEGLVIALMPAVGWWGWLYYTDLGSVATVLLSLRMSLGRRYFLSSLVSSLWFAPSRPQS